MPIYLSDASVNRDANAAMVAGFRFRQNELVYPKVCGQVTSTRLVEPFSIWGAFPLLRQFDGKVTEETLKSFRLNVPNKLNKVKAVISRVDMEMDQTRYLPEVVGQAGMSMALSPDYVLATKLKKGHLTASATEIGDDGVTYNATFEAGVPFFSAAHSLWDGGTQSNIITGSLPTTAAGIYAQDESATAQQLLRDFANVMAKFMGFKNDRGSLIHTALVPAEAVTLVVPPCLAAAAKRAFLTPGGLIGGSGGTSGSSGSASTFRLVKDVIVMGQLGAVDDLTAGTPGTTSSPTAETAYYVLVTGDILRPLYLQTFRPKTVAEVPGYELGGLPRGYSPEGAAKALIAQGFSVPSADMYASAIVDHNLNAIGSNATSDVVDKEQFFVAPRMRYSFVYGFWPNAVKVAPTGQST